MAIQTFISAGEPTTSRGSFLFAVNNPFPSHSTNARRYSLPTSLLATGKYGSNTIEGICCHPARENRKMLAKEIQAQRKQERNEEVKT